MEFLVYNISMLDPKDFSYDLPTHLIANTPATPRDHSKLLVLNRQTGDLQDKHFYDLADLLTPSDVLVLNQTRVFPSRLYGKKNTGGKIEILLLNQTSTNTYDCIGTNLKPNLKINFDKHFFGIIKSYNNIEFNLSGLELLQTLDNLGHTPLPPYINNSDNEKELRQKYQTVYAKTGSSAAAPTAGLHFTQNLLSSLHAKGVQIEFVNLNVGLGTFQNLRPENIKTKTLHTENYELETDVATRLNKAKQDKKRIIAVGTTTTRVLETCCKNGVLIPQKSSTNIFIFPDYKFKFIDSLITNFHLSESSLLMLVSAFISYPNTTTHFQEFSKSKLGLTYIHAIKNNYRFFSFGDAMWIY